LPAAEIMVPIRSQSCILLYLRRRCHMDIKKWVPWNWFKKEEEGAGSSVPIRRTKADTRAGYSDINPIAYFHQEIDRLFDTFFSDRPSSGMGRRYEPLMAKTMLKPTLDLSATDKDYTITVEIPGVDQKDVKLELVNDTLTIRGEKKQEKEEKDKNYYRMERSYGSFRRVLSLPDDADQEGIKAKFKNGVLKVTMRRKALPNSNVKRIEVRGVEQ
jgi:HSP20 family protein